MTSAQHPAATDRVERAAHPGLLLLLLIALMAAVAAFIWLPGDYGRHAVSMAIAAFAVAIR